MKRSIQKVIIVGQGISGTFLSWFCYQAGIDFIVIDEANTHAPSRVAAGIINPVTGRRVVKVWLDDVILPFAETAYKAMGTFLNLPAITRTVLIDFFPNPFMKESFLKKLAQKEDYISLLENEAPYAASFNYEFGIGLIDPAYIVHLQQLLPAWRTFLKQQRRLVEEPLDFEQLRAEAGAVHYKDHTADRLLFCDGAAGSANPYFSRLPFALNKGEALIIEAPELPAGHLYKKSMLLAPIAEPGIFWAGTNYIWDFKDEAPTADFRQSATHTLEQWLKVPFKIIDHKASVRPATVERRPFAGFHPVYTNIGILNGMGTKGCSLAPYFAHQLMEHLLYQRPLQPEVDISRFKGILSRPLQ
ncbi:NAD(P)/FAD-dependent oxidoreductase [Niabella drilacis]|uniref:Glycine/D-amino acid oxidase n=1 Tax=Niabella drilacis (strain DSM 25811 / CCM 8410 / CCUG 62505 / LMG 26954 / E90) TaxID=1285928 RepID=A0A1G6LBI9_NIADE|nr:FAD-dependent oxidoreductase [Niabella drilacis]SDC40006.1 Glycine/D-amino acid oxidase [Niabella drilacis]